MNEQPQKVDIAVVGTGFAGVCMAIQLLKNGFTDFIILERSNDAGGTWRDNNYPGAACDVHSHLYSFSFEPNPNWSRMFAGHKEIYDYTWHGIKKYGLEPHIRYGKEVTGGKFISESSEWEIGFTDGTNLRANKWLNGMGPLNRPVFPNLSGVKEFKGDYFHSSEWQHDVDLKGKKVAVVGTGASAIQVVPNIADTVKELHVFQRSAPWIIHKPDRPMMKGEKWLFKHLPFIQKLYRWRIYWQNELTAIILVYRPKLTKYIAKLGQMQLNKYIKDPELRKKFTPNYSMGCKRILPSNHFYPTFNKDHVHLNIEGIERITENGILDKSGNEIELDAIIYATGFQASEYPEEFQVTGKDGQPLAEVWKDGPEAYLGTTLSGFPNMFFIIGPNTGLGHSSMTIMIEASVQYIIECLKAMKKNDAKTMDVKQDVQDAFNVDIQAKLAKTIWQSGGCVSWYQTSTGKNTSLWPGFTFSFINKTKRVKEGDYEFIQ